SGALEYATDLFEAATIRRMVAQLGRVLEQVAEAPDRRLSTLRLLDEDERDLIIHQWNRTERPFPRGATLHKRFDAWVRERPEADALVWGDLRLSYAEVAAHANRLARHLRAQGVGPESRVGVLLERGPELIVSLLGIIKAGGCYVPLDPGYPPGRLALMLADCGARVLLTRGEVAPELGDGDRRIVRLDADADTIASEPAEAPESGVAPGNLAYIVYTSGSTGKPKGVMVAHREVVQLVVETDFVALGPGDRIAQASNPSFDALTFEMWGAFLNGATLVGIAKEVMLSPRELKETLRRERITTLYQTTALLNQLTREEPEILATLREVLFGGQASDADRVRALVRTGKPRHLLHVYGPTEVTCWCSCEDVRHVDDGALTVSCGRPIGNARIYILDSSLEPTPVGVPGEAYVGGAGVVRGYLGRPALTAERFIPDPFSAVPGARMYRTGDRMRWRDGAAGRVGVSTESDVASKSPASRDGECADALTHSRTAALEFVSRIDDQMKIRGFRIEPGEIEAVLSIHPDVREARVIVREDEPGEKRLVAYLVGEVEMEALRAHLRRTLPEYMVPAAFVSLGRLPLTPNGKLDVKALPVPEVTSGEYRYVAPRTLVEETLAEIWAAVLKVDRVGVHDGFFDLGGHSLLATRVISRVREVFAVEVPLRALFEDPTVARLAERVEESRRAGLPVLPPVVPVDREGPMPLSFAQERLWFLDRLQPGSTAYNISLALRLEGELDAAALERAVGEVVRRH
ncbi:MAG TPA: amino acid adenylation domain-containing protein, partial [Longimicrobiaceae bacterium]